MTDNKLNDVTRRRKLKVRRGESREKWSSESRESPTCGSNKGVVGGDAMHYNDVPLGNTTAFLIPMQSSVLTRTVPSIRSTSWLSQNRTPRWVPSSSLSPSSCKSQMGTRLSEPSLQKISMIYQCCVLHSSSVILFFVLHRIFSLLHGHSKWLCIRDYVLIKNNTLHFTSHEHKTKFIYMIKKNHAFRDWTIKRNCKIVNHS